MDIETHKYKIRIKTLTGFGCHIQHDQCGAHKDCKLRKVYMDMKTNQAERHSEIIDTRLNAFLDTLNDDAKPKITWQAKNGMFYAMIEYRILTKIGKKI